MVDISLFEMCEPLKNEWVIGSGPERETGVIVIFMVISRDTEAVYCGTKRDAGL